MKWKVADRGLETETGVKMETAGSGMTAEIKTTA